MDDPVFAAAQNLADLLGRRRLRIVFAESCTAGLVSATLARVPGISEWLCGSAVVYRLDTKHRWLGVPEDLLQNPGPVSREVACAMAAGVLERTPEAELSAAITGHLGPHAPVELDGVIWMAVARRTPLGVAIQDASAQQFGNQAEPGQTVRATRQARAAEALLQLSARCCPPE
jgi:PncC family amidohydrolase